MDNQNTHSILLKFEHDLTQMRDFMQNFQKEIDRLQDELRKKDDETQDLLHYIELKYFNASEGWNIANEMRKVRQERREMKDLLDLMKAADSKINGNFMNINILNEAIGEVRKLNKTKKTRYYMPRVRKDLTQEINSYNKRKLKVKK